MTAGDLQIADRLFGTQHRLVSSSDKDEVVDACARALRPHRLTIAEKHAKLSTHLDHLPLGPFSVSRLRYGCDVTVAPAVPEEDNFLITLPVAGKARFSYGSDAAEVRPKCGAVASAHRAFRFEINGAFDQIIVRLDSRRVEAVCASLVGSVRPQAVHFKLSLGETPAFWTSLLETAANLALLGATKNHPRLFDQFEELVIESLLLSQANNFSAAIHAEPRQPPPARIRRAMDYMRDHLSEPVCLSEVARRSGMSLRGLQAGFQRYVGSPPGRWLRSERLDMVHAVLSSAEPGTLNVTDVAMQCGFVHLGEFATQYRARFGKRPSDVLAKR
ncbi:AraC family transcriptional regulator [Bradyrhizobium sp. Pear76]|uniref:AraC-like ligand-binding domain-containing protein n=1 Tax=Bradyrhizobium oropedii TaxID=1571201 RepID=UPI001E394470|nr:AraC family transcriptional regulator [Bradyrhizobium oropedii]MCC8960755.1 AraC family transcriptional regulator [Bradyrhizobium oropedii]